MIQVRSNADLMLDDVRLSRLHQAPAWFSPSLAKLLGFIHIFDVPQLTDEGKLNLLKANGGKKDGNDEEIFQGQQYM